MTALLLLLTLSRVEPQGWDITFPVHPENIAVVVITECKGRTPYFAYDRVDIAPTDGYVRMRRQPVPDGRCTVMAAVIRNTTDDPADETYGDSAIVVVEEP